MKNILSTRLCIVHLAIMSFGCIINKYKDDNFKDVRLIRHPIMICLGILSHLEFVNNIDNNNKK